MKENSMKKDQLLCTLGTAAFLVGTGETATTVTAATWHNGTPAVLRGKWQTRTIHTPLGSDSSKATISKRNLTFNYFGSMPDKFTHVKWRKLNHHTYRFKAWRFIDGYQHRTHTITIKRTSQNTFYSHLDGHKYPETSVQELFHRK